MQSQVCLTRKVRFAACNFATPFCLDPCCDHVKIIMLVHDILQVSHDLFRRQI
jgi:hypothetical protein